MSLGASMFSYDPNQPESQRNQISFSTTYSYNTSWGQTGGGLTANQQSAINQNRALDERDRLRSATYSPFVDVSGVDYIYGGSGSGDIAVYANGTQYNNLASFDTIREREYQLNIALDLIVNAEYVDHRVKDKFKKYITDYYIVYTDTPFLELTPGDKVNTYNGVHHGDNFSGRTREYRTISGEIITYRVEGRGIEYSSLIWTHGGGYLSQNFIEVLIHEILHNSDFYGTGHSRIKNGMNIRERATQEANNFFQSYPELERYRR